MEDEKTTLPQDAAATIKHLVAQQSVRAVRLRARSLVALAAQDAAVESLEKAGFTVHRFNPNPAERHGFPLHDLWGYSNIVYFENLKAVLGDGPTVHELLKNAETIEPQLKDEMTVVATARR